MFKEFSPLLAKRSLVLTVASVGDERIRVTITPRPTGKDEPKELIQPFAVEGTAEELDNELPAAIVGYTGEHLTLERSLEQVKANMDAALKEVKDEAAKKIADAKKSNKSSSTARPEAVKPEVKKPAVPSLFDTSNEAQSVAPAAAAERPAAALSEKDDSEDSEGPEAVDDESKEQPDEAAVAAPGASSATIAQPGMFDTRREEDEILKEAFYGTDDNFDAA